MRRIFRILIGYSVACLGAAYLKLLFAITPAELASLPSDVAADRIADVVNYGWRFAVLFGLFVLPFAVVTIAFAEWRGVRKGPFYVLAGLGFALVGFLAQLSSEGPGAATVMHAYALSAYASSGLLAGISYWMISGRHAGSRASHPAPMALEAARAGSVAGDPKPGIVGGSVPATGTKPG
jgi:hypothetical protein